jgi:hypothetical protein
MRAVLLNEPWRPNYGTIIVTLYFDTLLPYNFYIKTSFHSSGVISLACRKSRKIITNDSSKRIKMIEN